MADRFLPLGFDELAVPAFFDTGDAAALERWKQAHPDWILAGTWTPDRPRRTPSAIEARSRFPSTGRLPGEADAWSGRMSSRPIDPANLSVADFQAMAAAAKAGSQDESPFIKVQSGTKPRAPARGEGSGPERPTRDEFLQARFDRAIRIIRHYEPRNPMGDILRDPARAATEEMVRQVEAEADLAMVRSVRVAPGPGEPDPATPLQRKVLRENLIREGFMDKDSSYEGHHIVPGGRPMSGNRDVGRAQERLRDLQIEIDSALNGVPLSPKFHRRLHTFEYYSYVNRRLERAASPREAVAFLRGLARRLQDEDRRFQQDETLPNWTE